MCVCVVAILYIVYGSINSRRYHSIHSSGEINIHSRVGVSAGVINSVGVDTCVVHHAALVCVKSISSSRAGKGTAVVGIFLYWMTGPDTRPQEWG